MVSLVCDTLRATLEPHSPGGAELFKVLYSVVKDTLKVDDEAVLSVVHQRVARDHDCDDVTEALLEVEEGAQVLDRTDVNKISEAQKQAAAQLGASLTYRESYKERWLRCDPLQRRHRARVLSRRPRKLLQQRRQFALCCRTTSISRMRSASCRQRHGSGRTAAPEDGMVTVLHMHESASPSRGMRIIRMLP